MSQSTDRTTLVGLFHTQEQTTKALNDLQSAGIPQSSIELLGSTSQSSVPEQSLAHLKTLNLPASDLQMLSEGLKSGGTLIIVRAEHAHAGQAEAIFERHHANQVDERSVPPVGQAKRAAATANEAVIPIVEEELVVGKRRVERGGVRVFSRLVETPVEEQVVLREEHAKVERHPVNRAISESEVDKLQHQTLEVHEMAEEAVVGKTARIVEEIHIEKQASERTEKVKNTVRRTKVEVEKVTPGSPQTSKRKK